MLKHLLVAIAAILIYLHTFFPFNQTDNFVPTANNSTKTLQRHHNRTILVIIDAMRYDFVSDILMPYTNKERNISGCLQRLKVETPTVTLPRIKALMMGRAPLFSDVLLNVVATSSSSDSSETGGGVSDSLLHRAVAAGLSVIFYGDDTWLRVFPGLFKRSEGTTSFFVNDFWEVDRNVTRHIDHELVQDDWNLMILHYLGLDHIGHVYGPNSPLIHQKLTEMDLIIEKLRTKAPPNTLVLITGDHGMKDGGGHGGATFPETHVPLIILGTTCIDDEINQIDLTSNLAVLMGIETPNTNTGEIKRSILHSLSFEEYLEAIRFNTLMLNEKSGNLCNLKAEKNSSKIEIYEKCAKKCAEKLSQTEIETHLLFFATFLILVIILVIFFRNKFERKFSIFSLITLIHPLLFFSTSFIEEEHQFWYYIFSSFLSIYCMVTQKSLVLWSILAVGLRFIRTINQVGDQFASLPDFSDFLLENPAYLHTIFITSLIIIFYFCVTHSKNINKFNMFVSAFILGAIFLFKFYNENNVFLARLAWCGIFVKFLHRKSDIPEIWLLIITLLLKPYNTIFVPFCLLCSRAIIANFSQISAIFLHLWLGELLYFLQGNCNSIASVDIAVGYVGLLDYNPSLVAIQIVLHTFAFPVLSHLLLIKNRSNIDLMVEILTLHRLWVVFIVYLVSAIQIQHLFIWSVFAPKVIIESTRFGFHFIEMFCYKIFFD